MNGEEALKKDYQETLDYLFGLQRFGIKLGLDNIRVLLNNLGNPHLRLPAVHIAGSNGKGSTAAFLTSILRQAGLRVGLYTSPHLVDFSERIQVNGVPIPTAEVIRWTEYIREVLVKMGEGDALRRHGTPGVPPREFDPREATITFFEFTTAMAFLHFRKAQVDLAVLESGMGGTLDATNVIDPLLCLITSISIEHQQYLGKTLIQIAGEKAGIIKPQRPLLTSAVQPRVISLLRQKCLEVQSPFLAWKKDFSARKVGPQVVNFQGRSHRWKRLHLGLAGEHQVANASLALAAAEVLTEAGYPIQETHVRQGLADVRWPGRLELAEGSPQILLDGAHNPGATRVLKKALQAEFPRRHLILVMGVMADKNISQMMADLVPLADLLILTRPQMDRAASLDLLRTHAAPFQKPTLGIAEVSKAVENALAAAGEEDLIVVTGSLFTVGEARAYLISRGRITV